MLIEDPELCELKTEPLLGGHDLKRERKKWVKVLVLAVGCLLVAFTVTFAVLSQDSSSSSDEEVLFVATDLCPANLETLPTCNPVVAMPDIKDGKYIGGSSLPPQVTDFGALTFESPITTPPGTHGFAPHLSLTFSSQRMDNHLMGMGHQLKGLSMIHRCHRTILNDGARRRVHIDEQDRFCFDGQRLIQVSEGEYGGDGTEYRTEVDSRIRFFSLGRAVEGGPLSFEAQLPNGNRILFGEDENSRIMASAKVAVNVWASTYEEDVHGNYMKFSYMNDQTIVVPTSIEYTGNLKTGLEPYAKVTFDYESRPDVSSIFIEGNEMITSVRLSAVRTYVDDELVKQYLVGYEQSCVTNNSRAVKFQQCDGSGICLEPVTMQWGDVCPEHDVSSYLTASGGSSETSVMPQYSSLDISRYKSGDLVPNGNIDLLYIPTSETEPSTIYATELFGSGSIITHAMPGPVLPVSSGSSDMQSLDLKRYYVIDMNGDGYPDIYAVNGDGKGGSDVDTIYLSDGNGNFDKVNGPTTKFTSGTSISAMSVDLSRVRFGDFNGDGLMDIYYIAGSNGEATNGDLWLQTTDGSFILHEGVGPPATISSALSQAAVDLGEIFVEDMNADGHADFYVVNPTSEDIGAAATLYMNNGDMTWTTRQGPVHHVKDLSYTMEQMLLPFIKFGDFNGDGYQDIAEVDPYADVLRISINKGTEDWSLVWEIPGIQIDEMNMQQGELDAASIRILKFDDRNDLCDVYVSENVGSYDRIFFNQGQGNFFEVAGIEGNLDSTQSIHYQYSQLSSRLFSDFTGSGNTDIYQINWNDISGQLKEDTIFINGLRKPELEMLRDSYGAENHVSYTALSNSTSGVYQSSKGAVFPVVDVVSSMRVVSSLRTSNGIGGLNHKTFRYVGYQYQVHGLGPMGHQEMWSKDEITGLETQTVFGTDWSMRQQHTIVEYRELDQTGFKLLDKAQIPSTRQSYPGVYVVEIPQSITMHWSYDTQEWESNITTISTFDNYSNPLSIKTKLVDVYHEEEALTEHEYINNEEKWILSMNIREVKTLSRPGYDDVVTVYLREYDTDKGLVTKTVADAAEDYELRTYIEYDGYGNAVSSTESGNDIAEATVTKIFETRGRSVISVKNALGHVSKYETDHRFGKIVKTTDPNQLVSVVYIDDLNRELAVQRPDCQVALTTRHWCMDDDSPLFCPVNAVYRKSTLHPDKKEEHKIYDNLHREIRTLRTGFDGAYAIVDVIYDEKGRKIQWSEPYFNGDTIHWNKEEFDVLGRSTMRVRPDGSVTRVKYMTLANTETNSENGTTTAVHDANGRILSVTDPKGGIMFNEFDAAGNIFKVTDALNNEIVYRTHDKRNIITSEKNPDMGLTIYENNAVGLETRILRSDGSYIDTAYDALRRKISKKSNDNNVTYQYDHEGALGMLYKVSTTGQEMFTKFVHYDHYIRQTCMSVSTPEGQSSDYMFQTEFDSLSRESKKIYPGGFTQTREYNEWGYRFRVSNYTSGKVFEEILVQDAHGKPTEIALLDGVMRLELTYDSRERVTEIMGRTRNVIRGQARNSAVIEHDDNGATEYNDVIVHRLYNWNGEGHLLKREDVLKSHVETFHYDELDRLVEAVSTKYSDVSIEYDATGNIVHKTDVGDYFYGDQQHAVSKISGPSGDLDLSYSSTGNVELKGGLKFNYNGFNLVKSVIDESLRHSSSFLYSPGGSLLSRRDDLDGKRTKTLYLSHFEEFLTSDGGVEYRYYPGVFVMVVCDSKGEMKTSALLQDHLHSVILITDEWGFPLQEREYDAFGRLRGDLEEGLWYNTDKGFVQHRDIRQFELIHMMARMYDPVLGRFLAADTIIQFPHNGQSYNPYSYALNAPLSCIDPSGHGIFSGISHAISKTIKAVGHVFKEINHGVSHALLQSELLRTAVQLAIYVGVGSTLGPVAAAWADAAFETYMTKSCGASWGQALKAGAITGLADTAMAVDTGKIDSVYGQIGADSLIGGAESLASGGKFTSGALTAGVSSSVNHIPGLDADSLKEQSLSNSMKEVWKGSVVGFGTALVNGENAGKGMVNGMKHSAFHEASDSAKDFALDTGKGWLGIEDDAHSSTGSERNMETSNAKNDDKSLFQKFEAVTDTTQKDCAAKKSVTDFRNDYHDAKGAWEKAQVLEKGVSKLWKDTSLTGRTTKIKAAASVYGTGGVAVVGAIFIGRDAVGQFH